MPTNAVGEAPSASTSPFTGATRWTQLDPSSLQTQVPTLLRGAVRSCVGRTATVYQNVGWSIIGNFFYAFSQWIILVIIARLSSPELLGRFALAFATSAPIFLVTNLQLRAVESSDLAGRFPFAAYFWLRVVSSCGAVTTVFLLSLLTGQDQQQSSLNVLIAMAKAVESVSDVIYGFFQKQQRMNRVATSLLVKGIGSVIAVTIALILTANLMLAALSLTVSWLLLLTLFDLPGCLRHHRDLLTVTSMRSAQGHFIKLWRLAWPLGIVGALASLNQNLPRYVIGSLGYRELGIYSGIASLMLIGGVLGTAVSQALLPKLSRDFASAVDRFRHVLLMISALMGAGVAVGLCVSFCFGSWILRVVYGQQFESRPHLLMVVVGCAGALGLTSVFQNALTAGRQNRTQLGIQFGSLAATAVCSGLLVHPFGATGAALVLLTGLSTQSAFCLRHVQDAFRRETRHRSTMTRGILR